ncbi:endo-1,3;1,4-beta-D-glucanase isoform X2 [Cicer arietinum]|uniref:Endo-1,31,4-beta-D-glucanase isoform X2 n=1 Tax=Cicer arietinum TaxID=3827 RepID=A0A3Q7XFJ8_CICAR|nr:endo-1,3;1,4-beta-D-glucanase isoform X2 [Cicer arietinum]
MSGPECCSNPPILNSFTGVGHVDNIGGLLAYLTGSPLSTIAVLFVSDIFGSLQTRLQHVDIMSWFLISLMDKGFEASQPIIEALKSKGVSAIGAAGFCWGAKTVCELGKSRLTQAIVLAHPSSITVEDINGLETCGISHLHYHNFHPLRSWLEFR